jgi:hypothetical protein
MNLLEAALYIMENAQRISLFLVFVFSLPAA